MARKSFSSFSCAGIISAEWKGAETGRITARLAPELRSNFHRALHRIGMAGNDGLLRRIQIRGRANFSFRRAFAGILHHCRRNTQDRGHRALLRWHGFLHIRPRLRTRRTASAKFNAPAATSAEYSPRLCPATKSGDHAPSPQPRDTPQRKRSGWPAGCSR